MNLYNMMNVNGFWTVHDSLTGKNVQTNSNKMKSAFRNHQVGDWK